MRRQKTDEFAALSRRSEDRKPSARVQRTEDRGQKTGSEDRGLRGQVQRTAVREDRRQMSLRRCRAVQRTENRARFRGQRFERTEFQRTAV
ncbi:MAG: hypothetical protein LBD06_09120 [Candidatus Accumulibacter sp.]|nr:hypothetical protein [Accumulibacter sp.]